VPERLCLEDERIDTGRSTLKGKGVVNNAKHKSSRALLGGRACVGCRRGFIAQAAAPEFVPVPKKAKFTSKSGAGKMKAGSNIITCAADTDKGEVTGPKTVAKVVVVFTGCKGENNKKTCEVHSTNPKGGKEEVVTKELSGELGTTAESATGVGLSLKPTAGNFVELEGSCLTVAKTSVAGGVVGEVTPVKTKSKTGKLVYTIEKEKQKIQKFNGKAAPLLEAFGFIEAPLETSDDIEFEEELEVTSLTDHTEPRGWNPPTRFC
jgi:hypothetical protein